MYLPDEWSLLSLCMPTFVSNAKFFLINDFEHYNNRDFFWLVDLENYVLLPQTISFSIFSYLGLLLNNKEMEYIFKPNLTIRL